MFFQHAQGVLDDISGQMFPQPPLVLQVDATGLSLRALEKNQRPQADTRMMVAPYWNTYATGSVCLGSMRAPKQASVSAMERWETSFYESAFTHPNDAQTLTTYPGGSEGLWHKLAGSKRPFPSKYLNHAKQSLAQFLKGKP